MQTVQWTQEQIHNLVTPIFEDVKTTFGVVFTRAGIPVILVTKIAGGEFPIMGMWWNGHSWQPARWLADGRYPSINEKVLKTDLDLLLQPEEPEKEFA